MNSPQPTYAAAFHCIGPACEDHCCGDWDIPLDKNTYEKYQSFPSQRLGNIVSQFVIVNHPPAPAELYAQIHRSSSGLCSFFGADRLCAIQKDYGPKLLSATCSIYPRSLSVVAENLEGALSLSCPEAARNVLLEPDFMHRACDLLSGEFRTDNRYQLASSNTKPPSLFLPLRNTIINLVQDRSRPLPDRLLAIGHLCKELDTDFYNLEQLSNPSLPQAGIDALPNNPRRRLETIFSLTDLLMQDGSSPRFQDTFWSFVAGISDPTGSLSGDDVDHFLQAEKNYHSPFFESSPFILENYLINYMFQNLFPYGRSGSADFIPQSIFAEFLQMTTQFAWINGLLIGIAGHHKQAFAAEHVIKAIQSFTRAVEHYPTVLQSINHYMADRGLNTLQGMAIMLKP
jgi:lysine-N-methylase